MRLLADENFPLLSVRALSEAGHDIAAVALDSPGIPDEAVLEHAARESRVLLTFDSDYGDLLYKQGLRSPAGVVYLRFVPASPQEPAEYLLTLLQRTDISISDSFTVAERDRIRQRPLPEARGE